jgi:ATP-dependent RNA helicase MSS116, mitochondrial
MTRSPGRDRAPRRKRRNMSTPASNVVQQTTAPRVAAPRVEAPPLTIPIPQNTPRFADLAEHGSVDRILVDTITQDLKFDHMMPVQAATLHELLPPSRGDCLVQAKTGTGKTIAFLLPAIQTLISKNRTRRSAGVSLLVISPTRELAMQIAKEADGLLQRMPKYKVCVAIGGTNKNTEENRILAGCDILVATPGRLFDHLSSGEKIREALQQLDTLVLDEADRLLDMGFLGALKDIIKCLPDKTATNRQGMLFSATIAEHVQRVAGLVLSPGYKFISTIAPGELNTHEHVTQYLITVPTFADLAPALVGAIRRELVHAGADKFKTIIFAPTAGLVDLYDHILSNIAGLATVSALHSRMTQSRRTKTTDAYRTANTGILIATDVVARGMDFPGVTAIFQVGLPGDRESYIHRLGRTARAGAVGRGIFIVAEAEAFFPQRVLQDISFEPQPADLSSAAEVMAVVEKMDPAQTAKCYQAWLGFYKNYLKPLRWDNESLVAQANIFARDGLGAPETPSIQRSTVGKMGLKGTKGLKIVPDAPRAHHNRGGAAGSSKR